MLVPLGLIPLYVFLNSFSFSYIHYTFVKKKKHLVRYTLHITICACTYRYLAYTQTFVIIKKNIALFYKLLQYHYYFCFFPCVNYYAHKILFLLFLY